MNQSHDPNRHLAKQSEKWRVFCAIAIPNAVKDRIRGHVNSLALAAPDVRASWTNTDNIHLTLRFLGDVETDRVAKISESAAAATTNLAPFQLRIGSTGVFPGKSRAKVLWIGIGDLSGRLLELHEQLETQCAKNGFAKEERSFKPHLTIARLRDSHNARSLVDAHLAMGFPEVVIDVGELIVFRSELSSHGSKYTAISKHRLTP